MKIVQINATCSVGSTGKICEEIGNLLDERGDESYVYYVSGESGYHGAVKYMTPKELKSASLKSRVLGNWGFNSKKATERLINDLDRLSPDIVHLHNIHGHNCDLGSLLGFLKEKNKKVIWTFHDCWAFTGYCMHFDMIGCDKWKTECSRCPQKKEYSWFLDRSRELFDKKKSLLNGMDLTIVTPSRWLSEQVKESFLSEYKRSVIPNGIDLSVFKPEGSDFRERCGIREKYMILGVSFGWSDKKGLDVFAELAKTLGEDYRIVLVGADEAAEKLLPDNIVTRHKTKDQSELTRIYSAADVFVNPTREENYPTVNMEALACGTPVITFDTGGSAEIIDKGCGAAVKKNDIKALKQAIINACEHPYDTGACLKHAESFDKKERLKQYLKLYDEVIG